MKRNIALAFALTLSIVFLQAKAVAEIYHIVHVKGKIKNKKTGKYLRVGDKIASTHQIAFSSTAAKAVVLSSKRGRFVLSANSKAKKVGNEFVAYVSNAVSPLQSNSKLSTRGGEEEKIMDLKEYFVGKGKQEETEGNPVYAIVGDKVSLEVDEANYQLTAAKVFVATAGSKKALLGKPGSGKITIDKAKLFGSDDPSKTTIWLFEKGGRKTELVSFDIIFIEEDMLKVELKEYLSLFEGEDLKKEDKYKELFTFVQDVYGTLDKAIFEKWLGENGF